MAEKEKDQKVVEGFVPTYSTTGIKEKNGTVAVIAIKNIHIEEGFNPRTSGVGDIDQLTTAIRKEGVLCPLLVRPKGKSTTDFSLIAGSRRLAAAKKAGLTEVPVQIRFGLEDNSDALALALAENSEDGRLNLTPMEQAHAFNKLLKREWSQSQIASETGLHPSKIQRYLQLLEAPADVKKMVEEDKLSASAAMEVAKASPTMRKQVAAVIKPHQTADDVKRVIKELTKKNEEGSSFPTGDARGKTGSARDSSLTTWRGKREVVQTFVQLCKLHEETPEDDKDSHAFASLRGMIAYHMWITGVTEEPYPPAFKEEDTKLSSTDWKKQTKEFTKYIAAQAKKLRTEIVEGEEPEEITVEDGDEEGVVDPAKAEA
jgi:ParB/RepB/Spo0J family partition protein